MINHKRKITWLVLLLGLSWQTQAAGVADDPIPAIEPGLEIDDRLLGNLGWVDSTTLLVTALDGPNSKFWERKVVRIDVRTGESRTLFSPGALICTNPMAQLAEISVGSEASLYTGNSKEPKPEKRLYAWNATSGQLVARTPGDTWNSSICMETKPRNNQVPEAMALHTQSRIGYLDSQDAYLQLDLQRNPASVVLIRNGNQVTTVQATPYEIAQSWQPQIPIWRFQRIRDEYLLSPGRFVMRGEKLVRVDGASAPEFPLVTMSKAGAVRREYFRQLFERRGLQVDGDTIPYAKGGVIIVTDRPKNGGGIYLAQGQSLKRIWCTNAGNGPDRRCQVTPASISISPDGCHFAFFAKGSDNRRLRSTFGPTLKILPLCN